LTLHVGLGLTFSLLMVKGYLMTSQKGVYHE